MATAAARGILLACEKTKLQEYGGPVLLGMAWAHSLLNRMRCIKKAYNSQE